MISPRFAAPVAVLLALALVPTVIHSYRGTTIDDGLRAAAVAARLDDMFSSPTERRAGWVRSNFDTDDWIERVYRAGPHDVTLFVARSYDAKRLYHHPELALLRGLSSVPAGRGRAAARPDIPLHLVTTTRDGVQGLGVYALLYGDEFVERPILFQLRASATLLLSGRRPLTLFMASDRTGTVERLDDAPATRVLLGAIGSFEGQAAAVVAPPAGTPLMR